MMFSRSTPDLRSCRPVYVSQRLGLGLVENLPQVEAPLPRQLRRRPPHVLAVIAWFLFGWVKYRDSLPNSAPKPPKWRCRASTYREHQKLFLGCVIPPQDAGGRVHATYEKPFWGTLYFGAEITFSDVATPVYDMLIAEHKKYSFPLFYLPRAYRSVPGASPSSLST